MVNTIIWTIAVITVLGLLLSVSIYLVAKKFKVEEDPRIDEVEAVMPARTAEAVDLPAAVRLPHPASGRRTSTTTTVLSAETRP